MHDEITFGQVVKERRSIMGLTQTELARRVGCAAITIRKIEADDMRPSVQMAELIALALNIPEEEQLPSYAWPVPNGPPHRFRRRHLPRAKSAGRI